MSYLLIWGASQIWSLLSWGTRLAQGWGWTRPKRLDCRVVSVGNIQAGGAGKTPLVAMIANEAVARGLKTAILCRGYGGAWEVTGGILRPGAEELESGACGDEAALLRELSPGAWIGIGADRFAQYSRLRRESGGTFDLVVLDDGFQNRKVAKDVEIVAWTSLRPGQAFFRDWASALRHADLVVWTKGTEAPKLPPGKPLVRARFRLSPPLTGAAVCLVTGVGDSAHVERSVQEAGYRVTRHVKFPDHARYDQVMVRELVDSATRRGERVVITGKDWVKWKELAVHPEEVLVLEPEVVFEQGIESWESVLWGR